jgi:DNA-binding response OmpR family regulator
MNLNPAHTVLIISDDAESAAAREMHFRQKNCAVAIATSPLDALRTAPLASPSLIILDLDLPHPERVSLCCELRAITKGAILVLSYTQDEQKILDYYLAGADEHFTAPLSPLVLLVKSMAWLVRNEWMDLPTQPSRAHN